MDKIKVAFQAREIELKLTIDLLCQFEQKFGAVTHVLKDLENGQLPYHRMAEMAVLILKDHADLSVQDHMLQYGIKDVQELLFHFCARYSLGQEYLKQVAGDPILGEG